MNQGEIIVTLLKALPYPDQVEDLDLIGPARVRFTWRGARFSVSDSLFTEEKQGGVLARSNAAILLEALLRREALAVGPLHGIGDDVR